MRTTNSAHQATPTRRTSLRLAGAACTVGAGVALVASLSSVGGTSAFATQASGTKPAAAAAAAPLDNAMFAVVDGASGGVFESNSHVLTSQKLGNGLDGRKYRVTFDRDLRRCSFFATPTSVRPGDIVSAGTGIAVRYNNSFATRQVVDVITKDVDGSPVFNDSSFSLLVQCAPPGA